MILKEFIKKLRELFLKLNSQNKIRILIIGGLSLFYAAFILTAAVGIYSSYKMTYEIYKNSSDIDLARKTQVDFYEQFSSWQNILVIVGIFPDSSDFRVHFHLFSFYFEVIQNNLFNLKLQFNEHQELTHDIDRLIVIHRAFTDSISALISEITHNKFENLKDKISTAKIEERRIMDLLNNIVLRIEAVNEKSYINIRMKFIFIQIILALIVIIGIVIFGRYMSKRLLDSHSMLERGILERTKEIMKTNELLKKEIENHILIEKDLQKFKNETEEKNSLISLSESKYKLLAKSTKDIIFTLDSHLFFKSSNNAVKDNWKISQNDLNNFRILDIISTDNNMLAIKLISQKIKECKINKKPCSFIAKVKTPNMADRAKYKFNLEFVSLNNETEIIGKAVKI